MSEEKLKKAIEAKKFSEVEEICKNLATQIPKIKISEDLIILAMDSFSDSTGNTKLVLKYITNAGVEVSKKSLHEVIDKRDLSYLPVLCSALQTAGGKISEDILIFAIQKYSNSKERNAAINTLLPIIANVSENTLNAFLARTKNDPVEGSEALEKILKVMREKNQPLSIKPLESIISSPAMSYAIILCKELITRKLALEELGKLLVNQIIKLPQNSNLTWNLVDAAIDTAAQTNTSLPESLLLSFLEGDTKTKIESEKGADVRLEYINKLLNITIKSKGSFSINAIEKIIDNFPGKPPEGFINAVINSTIQTKGNFSKLLATIIAKKDEAYVVAFCDGLTEKKVNLKNQELITPATIKNLSEKTAVKVLETAVLTESKLSTGLLAHAINIKSWACIDIICNRLMKQKEEIEIPEEWIKAAMDVPKGDGSVEACQVVMDAAIALGGEISEEVRSAVERKTNPHQPQTHTPPQTNKIESDVGEAKKEIFSSQNTGVIVPVDSKADPKPQEQEPSSGTMLDTLKAHKVWAGGNGLLIAAIIVLLVLAAVFPPLGGALAVGGLTSLAMAGIIGGGALVLWNALCAIGNFIENAFSKTPSSGAEGEDLDNPNKRPSLLVDSETAGPTSTASEAPQVTSEVASEKRAETETNGNPASRFGNGL